MGQRQTEANKVCISYTSLSLVFSMGILAGLAIAAGILQLLGGR